MLTTKLINDPDHWRSRAEEARTRAEEMKDDGARSGMLLVAYRYELLAERAEQSLARELKRNEPRRA